MTTRLLLALTSGLVAALAFGWLALPRLLYARAEQPLDFDHGLHASDKTALSCADCHALRDDGTFVGIPPLANCAGCHSEPVGETAEEKRLVEEYVRPGREIPWLVYARQPENVRFPHAIHVERARIGCERCHGGHGRSRSLRPHETNRISGYSKDIWGPSIARIGLRPGEGMKMSDCESCHAEAGLGRTSCLACHK